MAPIYRMDESFDHSFFAGSSVTFGVFDGVHVGHRYLLKCAQDTNTLPGGKSIALTFDSDPDEMFHSERLKKLMRNEDRIAMLADSGVDAVVVIPFTREFAANSPENFLRSCFGVYAPAHLHVGEDFRFGCKAAGTVTELRQWGDIKGCEIHAHKLVSFEGAPVTATRIRLLLQDCKIEEANRLLTRNYYLKETVQPGRGEGHDMGFRTANLQVNHFDRTLGEAVYGAYAIVDGVRYKAAVSVGVSPTFEATSSANIEVHIIDFEGDLYNQEITVEFMKFLRPMIKFESVDELIATVKGNIQWCRDNL
ncbi:MAG: riboflavin biosynthesis protein RibF [Eggerthellaceae bacterium]